jgi:hypothetical protein
MQALISEDCDKLKLDKSKAYKNLKFHNGLIS